MSILSVFAVPRVVVLGGVLSDEEWDVLIQLGAERMKPSLVVADGLSQREPHAGRTSSDAFLQRGMCDVVARVEARLAALVNWPVERGEGLQILQYDQGGEYKPHFDWFDPDSPGGRLHLAHGGQRVGTIVMYLNDAEKGGSTIFPKLGLQVMPKKGNAVFFANTGEFGQPDEMALHGGEPVVAGVKHVATKWLRTREFV
ncbi:MAG: 2OG-Fe(II) oxygenase [Herminiimonas sp.]|nr:2OG-Fe(II) oxygenase [Herminiimonas sp.]